MNPKIWTFTICWNESQMAPWFTRHYEPWVEKMVVWDEFSTDGTLEILKQSPKVDIRKWPHRGLDDNRFIEAVNGWYKEARGKADWILWVDMDELIYHPNILSIFETADGDIFPSTGYALVSKTGWPDPKSSGQLYDHVKTGLRQINYDKKILFRPSLDVVHAIGRHTYQNSPKHNGKECPDAGIKLLHCHHVGGVDETAKRNRRNYARAIDKKHAWNFEEGKANDNPNQSGSLAWVKAAVEKNKLLDIFNNTPIVVMKKLRKLHFGCGGNLLTGWENFDLNVNLRKPLPFPDGSASYIFAEHCIEHVSIKEAWNFFAECYRVLDVGGIVRIAIPDIYKIWTEATPEYCEIVKKGGFGSGTKIDAVKAAIFCHGHEVAWTQQMLETLLQVAGFSTTLESVGCSTDPFLMKIEGHGKVVGDHIAAVETSVVEGKKILEKTIP